MQTVGQGNRAVITRKEIEKVAAGILRDTRGKEAQDVCNYLADPSVSRLMYLRDPKDFSVMHVLATFGTEEMGNPGMQMALIAFTYHKEDLGLLLHPESENLVRPIDRIAKSTNDYDVWKVISGRAELLGAAKEGGESVEDIFRQRLRKGGYPSQIDERGYEEVIGIMYNTLREAQRGQS